MKRRRHNRYAGWRAIPLVILVVILGAAMIGASSGRLLATESDTRPHTEGATNAAEMQGVSEQTKMAAIEEDRRLARRIERRLAWDAKLAPYALEAKVNDSIVNLSGSVATLAESHRARRIANETNGVGGVVNALYVDPALAPYEGRSPTPPADATLTERLEVTLAHDADLADDESIQVEVENGIVRLDGAVVDYSSEMRAKRVAGSLYGVERVESGLEVAAP